VEPWRELRERREAVVWDRIVDARADLVLVVQCLTNTVALGGVDANRVLVVHVHCAIADDRGLHAGNSSKPLVQHSGVLLTPRGPGVYFRELHATDGSVDVGHTSVEPDHFVLVLFLHALVAQHAYVAGDLVTRAGDHT